MNTRDIPLPDAWPHLVRRAMLHVASLARWTMIYVHATSDQDDLHHVRSASESDRKDQEIALLKEELRIKNARMSKISPKNRPYYPPTERMAILIFKAARGWNLAQTAKAFGITEDTVSRWMAELDQEGENALVQLPVPVNKYPDFVQHVCQRLKTICPRLGKKTIAEYFARSGAFLSTTTVGRRLNSPPSFSPTDDTTEPDHEEVSPRIVTAKYPNHVWHVDLTTVPTSGGFSTSWFPFSLPQCWPFCWWVFLIVDHFSRKCVGFAVFYSTPRSKDLHKSLNRAIRRNGKPRHLISDKGVQFWPPKCKSIRNAARHPHLKWCKRRNIKPRFGAIGKHGSIAVIERFILTMKSEGTSQIIVPFNLMNMRMKMLIFVTWYNEFRPHQYLSARTPQEVYSHSPPKPPIQFDSNRELPELNIEVLYFEGRKHLPVIELMQAA